MSFQGFPTGSVHLAIRSVNATTIVLWCRTKQPRQGCPEDVVSARFHSNLEAVDRFMVRAQTHPATRTNSFDMCCQAKDHFLKWTIWSCEFLCGRLHSAQFYRAFTAPLDHVLVGMAWCTFPFFPLIGNLYPQSPAEDGACVRCNNLNFLYLSWGKTSAI